MKTKFPPATDETSAQVSPSASKARNHTQKKDRTSGSPARVRPSIKRDSLSPRDFMNYKLPWACEDCSHFNSTNSTCTLGYRTEAHLRENLLRMYEVSGSMTLCRFLEID